MRGIVFTAGHKGYFLNAYINCKLLRKIGCKLPIAWFYMGDEMQPEWIEQVNKIDGVTLHDLGGNGVKIRDMGGWQSKIEAIINAPFDEVLYLDADNFPMRDPEYLFDHPKYKETGAVLWPDIWNWQLDRMEFLNNKYGIKLQGARQVEGGQMMFDKTRCMPALLEIQKLNRNSKETYKVVYGDKDTFLIGLLIAKVPFYINEHQTKMMHGGLLQLDFDGKPLFQHLTGGKWQWHGRPMARMDRMNEASNIIKELSKIL
jgi:hypothetical protein